jgi:hypothetical protein
VVAIDPSATLLSCLGCAYAYAHKVAERRIRVSFGAVSGSSCSNRGVRGSQPTSTKAAGVLGFCRYAVTATA